MHLTLTVMSDAAVSLSGLSVSIRGFGQARESPTPPLLEGFIIVLGNFVVLIFCCFVLEGILLLFI